MFYWKKTLETKRFLFLAHKTQVISPYQCCNKSGIFQICTYSQITHKNECFHTKMSHLSFIVKGDNLTKVCVLNRFPAQYRAILCIGKKQLPIWTINQPHLNVQQPLFLETVRFSHVNDEMHYWAQYCQVGLTGTIHVNFKIQILEIFQVELIYETIVRCRRRVLFCNQDRTPITSKFKIIYAPQ